MIKKIILCLSLFLVIYSKSLAQYKDLHNFLETLDLSKTTRLSDSTMKKIKIYPLMSPNNIEGIYQKMDSLNRIYCRIWHYKGPIDTVISSFYNYYQVKLHNDDLTNQEYLALLSNKYNVFMLDFENNIIVEIRGLASNNFFDTVDCDFLNTFSSIEYKKYKHIFYIHELKLIFLKH